jgi:hypothetical protein
MRNRVVLSYKLDIDIEKLNDAINMQESSKYYFQHLHILFSYLK